jgi:hypothetical protein
VIVATGEQIYLHVNTVAGKASPLDAQVHSRLDAIRAAHAKLPAPEQQGRYVGMPGTSKAPEPARPGRLSTIEP